MTHLLGKRRQKDVGVPQKTLNFTSICQVYLPPTEEEETATEILTLHVDVEGCCRGLLNAIRSDTSEGSVFASRDVRQGQGLAVRLLSTNSRPRYIWHWIPACVAEQSYIFTFGDRGVARLDDEHRWICKI